jgi:hypothetical protein
MKKIVLILILLCIKFVAVSQTISFDDMVHLSHGKNEDQFLKSKSFKIFRLGNMAGRSLTYYVRNSKTLREESIIIGLGATTNDEGFLNDVNYSTRNTAYINNLVKQLTGAGLTRTETNQTTTRTTYRFDGKGFYVMVIINKSDAYTSFIALHHKP